MLPKVRTYEAAMRYIFFKYGIKRAYRMSVPEMVRPPICGFFLPGDIAGVNLSVAIDYLCSLVK
jgi:hypothetical protein